MIVFWHVYDMNISHKISQAVSVIIKYIKEKYQDEIGKMKVSRGKIHDYLVMTLDYITPGEVNIDMTYYIKNMIKQYPEKVSTSAATPASQFMFKTKNNV